MRCLPRLLATVVALLVLGGCAASSPLTGLPGPPSELPAAYVFSIYDAAVFEASEVQPLPSITDDTLTVVSWISARYAGSYPVGVDTTYAFEIWVTVAPQVQDACRGFDQDPDALRLRLQQYLGLPPSDGDRVFGTFRVARADLFRACTDPSLETTACSETVPPGVSDAHMAWVAGQMLGSYTVAPTAAGTGYPWTRMGYTYDWNPASPEVGAYEYVIAPGGALRVLDIAPTSAYCAR